MSALSEQEQLACRRAKLFIEEYRLLFAEAIVKGTKPSVAHHEAVRAAQLEFPVED